MSSLHHIVSQMRNENMRLRAIGQQICLELETTARLPPERLGTANVNKKLEQRLEERFSKKWALLAAVDGSHHRSCLPSLGTTARPGVKRAW